MERRNRQRCAHVQQCMNWCVRLEENKVEAFKEKNQSSRSITNIYTRYLKGAYETGSVYKENDFFGKGRYITSWNAQASVEWHPFTNDRKFRVFLHYIYRGMKLHKASAPIAPSAHDIQRLSAGVIYELPVL